MFELKFNGVVKATEKTENDCLRVLQQLQGQSWDYAFKNGWSMNEVVDNENDIHKDLRFIERFAWTKGRKYSIAILRESDTASHGTIVQYTNKNMVSKMTNIPAELLDERFDGLVRDARMFDGINYKEIAIFLLYGQL